MTLEIRQENKSDIERRLFSDLVNPNLNEPEKKIIIIKQGKHSFSTNIFKDQSRFYSAVHFVFHVMTGITIILTLYIFIYLQMSVF